MAGCVHLRNDERRGVPGYVPLGAACTTSMEHCRVCCCLSDRPGLYCSVVRRTVVGVD